MTSNTVEFAALRSEGEMRSWLADNGCPAHLAKRVVEQRTKQPGYKPADPQHVETGALLDRIRTASLF